MDKLTFDKLSTSRCCDSFVKPDMSINNKADEYLDTWGKTIGVVSIDLFAKLKTCWQISLSAHPGTCLPNHLIDSMIVARFNRDMPKVDSFLPRRDWVDKIFDIIMAVSSSLSCPPVPSTVQSWVSSQSRSLGISISKSVPWWPREDIDEENDLSLPSDSYTVYVRGDHMPFSFLIGCSAPRSWSSSVVEDSICWTSISI